MLVPQLAECQTTIDDALTLWVEVPHIKHPRLEELGDQGGIDRDCSQDDGLEDHVDIGQQLLVKHDLAENLRGFKDLFEGDIQQQLPQPLCT